MYLGELVFNDNGELESVGAYKVADLNEKDRGYFKAYLAGIKTLENAFEFVKEQIDEDSTALATIKKEILEKGFLSATENVYADAASLLVSLVESEGEKNE